MMARVECDDSTPETASLAGDATELESDQNTRAPEKALSGAGVAEHS